MTCRLLSQNDFAEVQDLWDYCFEKKILLFLNGIFKIHFSMNELWVLLMGKS